MLTNPAPLATTVKALRQGQIDLISYVDEMYDRVEKFDAQVEAILPEPDRPNRLRTEAKELQKRFAGSCHRG